MNKENTSTGGLIISLPPEPDSKHLTFLDLFMKIYEHDPQIPHPVPPDQVPLNHMYGATQCRLILADRKDEEGRTVWGVHCEQCHITNPLPLFINWGEVWKHLYRVTQV